MDERVANVLLVDDRPENLLALEEVLQRPGRRLFKASSGNQALKLMLRHEFAVVLLDVQMPEMDGYETAHLMRSVERSRLVPIIFVTAGDRSEERTFHGYEVGAVDFLYKPVNARILESKVAIFVELQRMTDELKACNHALERTTLALQERVNDVENVNQTLSHDLRAPLRSIHGFARILAETNRAALGPDGQDCLTRILDSCSRMGRMLDGLHALLRTSGAPQTFETVELGDVLGDVLADLGADIAQCGATVTHDRLPVVIGSRALLTIVFQNLIGNALKFRGALPPVVHVAAERLGGAWSFRVSDNGIGIDPVFSERVFEVFHRLASDSTPGAGVGLALCKQAIEKHGGHIRVEPAPGGGSVFVFSVAAQGLSQTLSSDSNRSTSTGLGM